MAINRPPLREHTDAEINLFTVYRQPSRVVLSREPELIPDEDRYEVLLNPNEFQIKGGSEYARLDVPGYSSNVVQWSHTTQLEYTFSLTWSYARASEFVSSRSGDNVVDSTKFLRFLTSFLHPVARGRAPSLMQVFWPNFLCVIGSVTELQADVTRFSPSGLPLEYAVDLTLLEHRRAFVDYATFERRGFRAPQVPITDPGTGGSNGGGGPTIA